MNCTSKTIRRNGIESTLKLNAGGGGADKKRLVLIKSFSIIKSQSSHSSIHDSYWLFASSRQVSSASGSSGSSESVLHESTSDLYSSWQSDLQSAIERRLNPKMINTKAKATIIHFFAMILAPSRNCMIDSFRLFRSVERQRHFSYEQKKQGGDQYLISIILPGSCLH